ncbi:hypothetical protein B0H14DRAFT_2585472 [Mycena olivaceomarginata]|nr:hypothetical protein B0H14DRAFT_2585472 [Mycena olivaceomarginata]
MYPGSGGFSPVAQTAKAAGVDEDVHSEGSMVENRVTTQGVIIDMRHLASIARPNESAWWHFRSIIVSEEAPIDGVGSESAWWQNAELGIWNEVMVLQGRKQSAVGSGDRISETPQHNGTG